MSFHKKSFMNTDALGRAAMDFYKGDKNARITVKSKNFDDDYIEASHLFRKLYQLPDLEKKAVQLCRGKILDVGAGVGCHSIILHKEGYDVYPIDTSLFCVEIMQERGLKNANCINFFELPEKRRYDTILMLMNGLGIAGSISGLKIMLTKAEQLLSQGGKILADSSDLKYLYENEDGSFSIPLGDDYYGQMSFIMSYKDIETKPFNWLYIDFDTLSEIAEELGFNCNKIYEGENYDFLCEISRKKLFRY